MLPSELRDIFALAPPVFWTSIETLTVVQYIGEEKGRKALAYPFYARIATRDIRIICFSNSNPPYPLPKLGPEFGRFLLHLSPFRYNFSMRWS